jgi:hypothetical protein
VARLAHVVTVGVEAGVALELATAALQFHCNVDTIYQSEVALGASSIHWGGALKTFWSTC